MTERIRFFRAQNQWGITTTPRSCENDSGFGYPYRDLRHVEQLRSCNDLTLPSGGRRCEASPWFVHGTTECGGV